MPLPAILTGVHRRSALFCRATLFLHLLGSTLTCTSGASSRAPAAAELAIVGVTVVDVKSGRLAADQTLLIDGNRIAQISPSGKLAVPAGARVVNGTSKFLIPGLWDMHVHLTFEDWAARYFPLFLANGVVGVRDMGGIPADAVRLRHNLARGVIHGPRVVFAGPMLDGPGPPKKRRNRITVTTESDGRSAVLFVKHHGFDFVKVYNLLSREAYFAIATEAKRQAIPFAGHVPFTVRAAEASDAGQRSMEHLYGVVQGCSSAESELMAKLLEVDSSYDRPFRDAVVLSFFDTYSPEKASELFARFVANNTWQVPTLVQERNYWMTDSSTLAADSRREYVDRDWSRELFKPRHGTQIAASKRFLEREIALVGAMHRAGVPLLAGTDSPFEPSVFPGFSLHDELMLLVRSGLSPLEALRTATLNPARYLDATETFGSVETGKMADLVLLDANPLVDIANTQKIHAVVFNGKLLSRPDLDALLNGAAAANSAPQE